MHPVRHLGVLRERALRRLQYLSDLAHPCRQPTDDATRRQVAFVLLEAVNLWAGFARSFYLSCVYRARRDTRPRVHLGMSGIVTATDAIHFAVVNVARKTAKPNRRYSWSDEPTWHQRETLQKLSTMLSLSNDPQVQIALNVQTSAFVHVVVFRNFFAHRGRDTVKRARLLMPTYGQVATAHPAEAASGVAPGRTQNIMADWLADMRQTIELICE